MGFIVATAGVLSVEFFRLAIDLREKLRKAKIYGIVSDFLFGKVFKSYEEC